jgi:uncharacterized membrane protein YfcA
MLMVVEDFVPKEAVPITMSIIFLCSIATFYSGVLDKQKNPGNYFVDYDMVIIIVPTLLIGTKIGSILNKITTKVIIVIIFTWFNAELILKIYKKKKLRTKLI